MHRFVQITAIFCILKKNRKKKNYGHLTGCNILPTDADGLMSPDSLSMVHLTMVEFVYSKQFNPQLHILRFQKGNTISRYGAYTTVLCSSAQTRHSYLVPREALRKRTSQNHPIGPNVTSDGPQRTTVAF